ncbi:hypothetical protein C5O00_08110 [Pukyongia salina]|uniref:Lipoprotein n=1 Tax=Pukyongia salina TaxID=2094025 RepID=A0A2S0HWZ0_9FLAO|nr:hypothetical protein [Pukyongia salina]AVI51140.1 hypothetical protein C5O00_08110 [Pukyongia salina]
MKYKTIAIASGLLLLLTSCKNPSEKELKATKTLSEPAITFQNKGHELIHKLVQKVGDYQTLRNKKDVVYTYTYRVPDGKTDVSTEKYIFDGELSYGEYKQHQRTLPHLEGTMEQGFNGQEFWLKLNGETITDTTALKRVAFARPTNFYWFTMFQKLLDPGLNYEYLDKKTIGPKTYDIVSISFESKNNKPTDIYQLYINEESGLVDQFLFTVADFGVIETPFLMQLEYEQIEDLLIPTKRKYKKSNWDALVTNDPWIEVSWTNIKFNNGLSPEDFEK